MLNNLLAIFIGSGIGAILRYLTTIFCKNLFGFNIAGTFLVNILGCFLIGFVFGLTLEKTELLPNIAKLFIIVGLLGGLTTFSTFSLEIVELLKNDKILYSLIYIFASCLVGIILTLFGFYLSKFV